VLKYQLQLGLVRPREVGQISNFSQLDKGEGEKGPLKGKGYFQRRPHLLRIAAWPASQPIEKIGGPGVVPQPIDFNNLQCQTSLTALTGAKDILPRCKTGAV
jgi:hypothetical protein